MASDAQTRTTRTRERHDGFGPRKRERFLEAFRRSANVSASCRAAGVGRQTYYDALNADPEWAEQVRIAEEEAVELLEAKAWSNALQRHSETSLWNLLKAHKPAKYRETTRTELTGANGEKLYGGFVPEKDV